MTNISYALCEVVADVTSLFLKEKFLPADSRDGVRFVIEWSEEFEALYAGEEWIDQEYLQVVETFFSVKYRGWLSSAAPCSVRENV